MHFYLYADQTQNKKHIKLWNLPDLIFTQMFLGNAQSNPHVWRLIMQGEVITELKVSN